MEINKFYCKDNLQFTKEMINENIKVNNILTSPPYNTSGKMNNKKMYNEYKDNKKSEEYIRDMIELFKNFEYIY